jgi:predicted Zn-dependent protease
MPSPFHPLRARVSAWWSSEPGRNWRFYGAYFRWPVLLVLGALALDKAIYYGAFPLADFIAGKSDCVSARIEFARGQNQAALSSIRAALLRTRTDPAFWKLAARIAGRLDSSEATYCWQQFDRLRPGVFPTQIRLAESALRYQQLDSALAALREVKEPDQQKIPFLRAAGELDAACGEKEQARDFFARVEAAHPHDAETLCALARWQVESGDPAEWSRAQAELPALLSQPKERVEAWRLLIRLARQAGDLAQAKKWSDDLFRSGDAAFTDRVQRLDFLTGSSFSAALDELMTTSKIEEIVPLAEWLVAHGQPEKALIWIRTHPEETQDDPRIGCARADCLCALGLWDHLRDIQADDVWPGHEPERLMYLTRAWRELGSEPDARAAWPQALLACRDYSDYLVLLDYIARNKLSSASFWAGARVQVWTRMVSQYPGQAWVVRALLQDAVARRDSLVIEECRAQLAALDPADADEAARYAFVCLLRGSRVEEASASLARLRDENPGDPSIITASAYDLYLQGKFGEALAALGELTAEELSAPERAAYLGALLAAAGPVDQARDHLQVALSRPELLDEERALVDRSQQLLAYREAMAGLLHPAILAANPKDRPLFALRTQTNKMPPIFQVGESVALSRGGEMENAARALAEIDPGSLDPASLSIYLGGVLDLAGEHQQALPWLELSADLPFESAGEKFHRAVEAWWSLQSRAQADPAMLAGLFAAYRGLDDEEEDRSFWMRDESREMQAVRIALLNGVEIGAAQERLHGLLRHVPFTPEIQAQLAYALLLQGQAYAAQQRMEVLAPADLVRPEPSLFYGVILAACGEKRAAEPYLRRAAGSGLIPEESALAARTEKMP